MKKENIILIAESNDAHFELIIDNLLPPDAKNKLIRFTDGQNVLEFLSDQTQKDDNLGYILLMDIDIPNIDGVKLLEKIKKNAKLKKLPVIILTARDDQNIIEQCYNLGCGTYLVKPKEKHHFAETVRKIGAFLSIIEITQLR